VNITSSLGASVLFLFLAQICVWTSSGPLNTVSGKHQ
jgi:low affinity Fe/Cu permease